MDDSPGVAGIGHVVAEAGDDLAEPDYVSAGVAADLSRTQVSCRRALRQLIALRPPHGVDVETEIVSDLLEGCSAVQLAATASVEIPRTAGMPIYRTSRVRPASP